MSVAKPTVVVLGLGLIGGSLARALRSSGFSDRIIGCGYREPSLQRGLELGIIDEYTLDVAQAVSQADILVLCAPTLTVSDLLETILPMADGDGPVITDVASVKGNLRATAMRVAGEMPAKLVLGHPIAGSERSGVEASDVSLFVNHRVILTPEPGNDPAAVALVRQMWEATGAEVVDMDVDTHDAVLAATSHLPHVLAYTLVDALAAAPNSDAIFRCAAGGFRDFTRIASSDPVMWRDIALANRDALLVAIDHFGAHLATLRDAVERSDSQALQNTFSRAKQARDHFADILVARSQGK